MTNEGEKKTKCQQQYDSKVINQSFSFQKNSKQHIFTDSSGLAQGTLYAKQTKTNKYNRTVGRLFGDDLFVPKRNHANIKFKS